MNDNYISLELVSIRLKLPQNYIKEQANAGNIPHLIVGKRKRLMFIEQTVRDALHQLEQPKSDYQEFESSLSFIKGKGLKVSFVGAAG